MQLALGNTTGLWALSALPLLLLIHLIQQRRVRVLTSTMFLLERLQPLSSEGRRIDWLRVSKSLLLQIACLLLLTLFLSDLHVVRQSSRGKTVLVIDDSYSMWPFQKGRDTQLTKLAAGASAFASTWVVLRSSRPGEVFYRGDDSHEMLKRVADLWPAAAGHDPLPAIHFAQSLLKGVGSVIFVTDHHYDPPPGVGLMALGGPLENWGFSGLRTTPDGHYTFLLKNFGKSSASRQLWSEDGATKSAAQDVTLKAGEMRVFEGRLPAGSTRLVWRLSADAFPLDDLLPLRRPEPRQLKLQVAPGTELAALGSRLAASLPAVKVVRGERGDLLIRSASPEQLEDLETDTIQFLNGTTTQRVSTSAPVLIDSHPLVEGLSFDGLLAAPGPLTLAAHDVPLLWSGDKPLAFLRALSTANGKERRLLLFNFALGSSTALRNPHFVILLQRFFEIVRARVQAGFVDNYETGETLGLEGQDTSTALTFEVEDLLHKQETSEIMPLERARVLRAPGLPSYFRLSQGAAPVVQGACYFADSRESDFSAAKYEYLSSNSVRAGGHELAQQELRPLWALLLLAALLASFAVSPLSSKGGV